MKTATVLDDTTNMVVVRVEGRNYPGLVLQGDQLAHLLYLAKDEAVKAELRMLIAHYNKVCQANGI